MQRLAKISKKQFKAAKVNKNEQKDKNEQKEA